MRMEGSRKPRMPEERRDTRNRESIWIPWVYSLRWVRVGLWGVDISRKLDNRRIPGAELYGIKRHNKDMDRMLEPENTTTSG